MKNYCLSLLLFTCIFMCLVENSLSDDKNVSKIKDDLILTDEPCEKNGDCKSKCKEQGHLDTVSICFSPKKKCICKRKDAPTKKPVETELLTTDMPCIYDNECKHKCNDLGYYPPGAKCDFDKTGMSPKKCKCPQSKEKDRVQLKRVCQGLRADCKRACGKLGYPKDDAQCSKTVDDKFRCSCKKA